MGITVRSHGQAGEILVEDERDDGSIVFLICRPWNAADGSGIVVGPGEPPDEDKELQGTFPLAYARAPESFRIVLDTTALPAGPLQFQAERFIDTARAVAAEGATRVRLDESNARDWGLLMEEPLSG